MKRVDWSLKLKDPKGAFIQDENKQPVTLGEFVCMILYSLQESDAKMNGEEKYKIYKLGKKISDNPKSEFSVEELAIIKEHVGRKATTFLVGEIYDIIESSGEEKANEKS